MLKENDKNNFVEQRMVACTFSKLPFIRVYLYRSLYKRILIKGFLRIQQGYLGIPFKQSTLYINDGIPPTFCAKPLSSEIQSREFPARYDITEFIKTSHQIKSVNTPPTIDNHMNRINSFTFVRFFKSITKELEGKKEQIQKKSIRYMLKSYTKITNLCEHVDCLSN